MGQNTGDSFEGDVSMFDSSNGNVVPITLEILNVDGAAEFGILSGDDLMAKNFY